MAKLSTMQRYEAAFPKSKALYERAQKVQPRGVSHDQWYASPFPLYMNRARGSHIWDVDGNEYIDYYGGHGGKMLGHAHPAVVEAVQRQIEMGIQYGAGCDLAVGWAELIQKLVPSAERIEFMNSGTEAIMYGIRLSRAFTKRSKVVRFQFHFAGAYDAVTLGYKKPFDVPVTTGVLPSAVQDTVVVPMNNEEALEEALKKKDVAVVITEAAGSSSGVVGIKPSFYRTMRELTAKYGTLLFFDEIVTGFRYSPGGVQAAVGVTPDLTSLGKGITGVMPGAGAIVGRQEVMDLFLFRDENWNRYDRVSHSGTFNANPLCAASGIAYLKIIATGEPTRIANQKARQLRDAMQGKMDERGIPGCVYDSGFSIVHVYSGKCDLQGKCDRVICLNADKTRDPATGEALFMNLALNGVKTPTRGYDFFLSAVHTEHDLRMTITAFGNSLDVLLEEKKMKKEVDT
jgi:glutamate-1-semialdehyde 2,1-aminomutase